jgi:transposase-like protein
VNIEEVIYIVDGSKGFRKAIKQVCGEEALIQRCTWHKLENIKGYLAESDHHEVSSDYYHALNKEDYESAKAELLSLELKLRPINEAAANSLLEVHIPVILTPQSGDIDPPIFSSITKNIMA